MYLRVSSCIFMYLHVSSCISYPRIFTSRYQGLYIPYTFFLGLTHNGSSDPIWVTFPQISIAF